MGKEERHRSLIGKIHGEKVANYTGLQKELTKIWGFSGPFKVRELGVNLYQFVFASQKEKMKVLHGKAWTFDSQFIILKPGSEDTDFLKESFNRLPLWIQVWNLPNQWILKETGFKLKNVFSNVMDVLTPESGSKQGRHVKILEEVDISRALLRGTKVQYDGREVWVDFRYENVALFWFYCGKVSHSEKTCACRQSDAREGKLLEGQYEDWLRADTRRIGTKQPNPKAGTETGKESNNGVTKTVLLQERVRKANNGEQISCAIVEIERGEGTETVMEKAQEVQGEENGQLQLGLCK